MHECVCVRVCVRGRARVRVCSFACVCVCVCVWQGAVNYGVGMLLYGLVEHDSDCPRTPSLFLPTPPPRPASLPMRMRKSSLN